MTTPLKFKQVGQLTGEELERAQAYLARLPQRAGHTGPSVPSCPHTAAAHLEVQLSPREEPTTWCPWCSGDIEACGVSVVRWLRQEVEVAADPALVAEAEALRARGCVVVLPAPAKGPRVATAWDVAAALGVPRKFTAQLLRWLQRAGQVACVGTAESTWAPTGERMVIQAWRAR